MTDVTARLDAIQATVDNHKKSPGGIYGPGSDVAYLLNLARAQQAALDAVRVIERRLEKSKQCEDREIAEDLRAALEAKNT